MLPRVFIGWDVAEKSAWNVASWSLTMNSSIDVDVQRITMSDLGRLYSRQTESRDGHLWDVLSDAPMSTAHAIARFFIPYLLNYQSWALFMDGDILVRGNIAELFALADPQYAVMCVQHNYWPVETEKKSGAIQTAYSRKNWSSVMLMNCEHEANRRLTLEMLNTLPGRDLHRFCWLQDSEIGALPEKWNWLVGHSSLSIDPAIVHFTEGLPDKQGYENVPFADHWRHVKSKTQEWVRRPVLVKV